MSQVDFAQDAIDPDSVYICRLTIIEIHIKKIRRSQHRHIFVMGIALPGRAVFILNQGPDL